MKKSCALLVVFLALVAGAIPVCAADASVPASPGESTCSAPLPAEVEVGGVVFARFTVCHLGLAPQERAALVYRRLWDLLDASRPDYAGLVESVRVRKVKGDYVIEAAGRLVVTIDPAHARVNKVSPQELAEIWAKLLRAGLSGYIDNNRALAQ